MAEKPKTKNSAKAKTTKPTVMDVTKPGKSTPSASSRPIIVGHKVMTEDPMVNKSPAEEDKGEKITVSRPGKKVIAPIDASAPEEAVEAEQPDAQVTTPAEEAPGESSPVVEDEPASDEPTEGAPVEEPAKEDKPASDKEDAKNAAMVKTVVEQAEKSKKQKNDSDNKLTELEKKRQAELDKLVEERKYYVPVGQVTKKKRRLGLLLFLLVLLAAAGAYLALDAQLIKNDIKLPYEFFKEQETEHSDSATHNENQMPASSESVAPVTKSYIDSTKTFSLAHPSDWKVQLDKWGEGTDGPILPEPDWTKVTHTFAIIPATGHKDNNVRVAGSCTTPDENGKAVNLIDDLKANTDQFHTQKDVTINGYKAFYDKTAFRGDAETYVDHLYVITKDDHCVSLQYRENHHHDMSDTNYDDKANMPKFEAIVNSIKFLK